LIDFENKIYSNKFYVQSATLMIQALMEYIPVREEQLKRDEAEKERIKNLSNNEKRKLKKQKDK